MTNKYTLINSQFVVIFFLILLLLYKCNNKEEIYIPKTKIVSNTIVKSKIDTLRFEKTKYTVDTLYLAKKEIDTDSNFVYTTNINDSLLSGVINTTVKKDGTFVYQNLEYSPKFPKYIIKTDSITTTNTIYRHSLSKNEIYGGITLSPYYKFNCVATLGVKTKKDKYIGVGYDPFNKNGYVEFKLKIFTFKK